ncbi:hypothetical protein VP01_1010g3 [Puccinia sorghi]|uniref:Uncharacterized protein n=1 Tax=Puccinia sorghi TaxID=27349 RepID=A0A0L6VV18_9BASI|nr:hypothetical protein VP01_1010g3 [Puccinia sorghi]
MQETSPANILAESMEQKVSEEEESKNNRNGLILIFCCNGVTRQYAEVMEMKKLLIFFFLKKNVMIIEEEIFLDYTEPISVDYGVIEYNKSTIVSKTINWTEKTFNKRNENKVSEFLPWKSLFFLQTSCRIQFQSQMQRNTVVYCNSAQATELNRFISLMSPVIRCLLIGPGAGCGLLGKMNGSFQSQYRCLLGPSHSHVTCHQVLIDWSWCILLQKWMILKKDSIILTIQELAPTRLYQALGIRRGLGFPNVCVCGFFFWKDVSCLCPPPQLILKTWEVSELELENWTHLAASIPFMQAENWSGICITNIPCICEKIFQIMAVPN